MKKDLEELELTLPVMDFASCKQLFGGTGYMDDDKPAWTNYLDNVDCTGDKGNSLGNPFEHGFDIDTDIDFDWDDEKLKYPDLDQEDQSGFDKNKMLENAQPQIGNSCSFAAIAALLAGYGKNTIWTKIASVFFEEKGKSLNSLQDLQELNGVSIPDLKGLLDKYFDETKEIGNLQDLNDALQHGAVLGIINPGDVNNDGDATNDGHAIVVTGYNTETGQISGWDPETGKEVEFENDGFVIGWEVGSPK